MSAARPIRRRRTSRRRLGVRQAPENAGFHEVFGFLPSLKQIGVKGGDDTSETIAVGERIVISQMRLKFRSFQEGTLEHTSNRYCDR